MQFDIFKKNVKSTYNTKNIYLIKPFTIHVSNPAHFYMVNLPLQGKKILSTIRELEIDVVFGSNLAVCTIGFEVAKIFGIKKIFDLSDFFPASANAYNPEANKTSANFLFYLAKIITDYNIKKCDLCTTCSIALQEYAMDISLNKYVKQLPNGVDTKIFIPKSPNPNLIHNLELSDNVLVFVGSIESWLDFDIVLDSINILKKEKIDLQLLIIGRSIYSEKKNSLFQKIEKKGLQQQIKFLGYQPYEKLPDFINLGIGGLIPFRTDSLLTKMAFPNKLIEYLSCGKPVFAPPLDELRRVGGKNLFGYTSPESLALQIKKAISTDYDTEEIRRSVLGYDWGLIANKLEGYMHKLIE